MKREAVDRAKSKQKFVAPPCAVLLGLPLIAEAVADAAWDDGTPRDVYTLTLSWAMGSPQVSLNDKEEGRSISSSGKTIEEALHALEGLLGTPHRPWRYWKGAKKR